VWRRHNAASARAVARRSGTVVEFDRARDLALDCAAVLIATGNVMSVVLVRIAAGSAACLLTLFAGTAFAQEYRTALQISPQGGGNCIEVVNREIVRDQRMQMMPCNNSPAQTFTHDPATMHLTIGGFCIDVNGGQPGDLVRLWFCDGGAKQAWKPEQKGNFTKFVGSNGLCLDIRYGSKEVGASVQTWNCGDAEPNQLWSLQRK
jgi:hypothetical protein